MIALPTKQSVLFCHVQYSNTWLHSQCMGPVCFRLVYPQYSSACTSSVAEDGYIRAMHALSETYVWIVFFCTWCMETWV